MLVCQYTDNILWHEDLEFHAQSHYFLQEFTPSMPWFTFCAFYLCSVLSEMDNSLVLGNRVLFFLDILLAISNAVG